MSSLWATSGITYGKMLETVVHALGKVEGFGAVMDCAAQLWAETDPVGALTVGPARGMRRMGDGPKYRKKPVVIEATQWHRDPAVSVGVDSLGVEYTADGKCQIQTLEGPLRVSDRDWIITRSEEHTLNSSHSQIS